MSRRLIQFIAMCVLSVCALFSQSKMDMSLLRQTALRRNAAPLQSCQVIVSLKPGCSANDLYLEIPQLRSLKAKWSLDNPSGKGSVMSLCIPVSMLARLDHSDCVASLSAPRHYQPTCANTRREMHVTELQDDATAQLYGLPRCYTGRGVLLGIVDIGIEYNHLNFRDPETGQTRIKGAVLYRPTEGAADSVREYYTDPALIDTLTTDTHQNGHGTQTASMAAASYPGLQLLGMAPQADLMLCGTSSLTDDRLIDAMQQTFARADELGEPCVINLSIGNSVDWKDGLTPFCLACDALTQGGTAPGRIIIVSAGNDGDKAFGASCQFCDTMPAYALLQPLQHQGNTAYLNPNIDVYCSDSLPLSVDYVLYDTLRHTLSPCPFEQHWLDTLDAGHGNRRHLCLDADTCMMTDYPDQVLAARFRGCEGSSVTAYYLNDFSVNYRMYAGDADVHWMDVEAGLSISDLCCTDAVLSAGAYSVTDSVVNIFGRTIISWCPQGQVCSFSSYGTTWQGVPKPDVLCPGAGIVTGFSAYYDDKITYYYTSRRYLSSPMMHVLTPDENDTPWYKPEESDRTYYWIENQGTSFSSPALAGIVALWLEACPTLSVADIRTILQHTSHLDQACAEAPGGLLQVGAGKADALAGIQAILDAQGIRSLAPDNNARECRCYDMMGRPVTPSAASAGLFIKNGKKIIIR